MFHLISWLGATIGGASGIVGGIANAVSANKQNRKNRAFAREMYQTERKDNLEFWNLQNQYNTPQAQMMRFKEAGLNPNLMYGQGSAGLAGNIDTPGFTGVEQTTPQWGDAISAGGQGALQGMETFANIAQRKANQNVLAEQAELLKTERNLKNSQIIKVLADTKVTNFDYEMKKRYGELLSQMDVAKRSEEVRGLQIHNAVTLRQDARNAALNSSNLKEALLRMSQMQLSRAKTQDERRVLWAQHDKIRQEIQNLQKDGIIKQWEIDLNSKNISKSDPAYWRKLGEIFNSFNMIMDTSE